MSRAILVNTHKGNEVAVERLLQSCMGCGDVIVVSGGHEIQSTQIGVVTRVSVVHDSIDFTGLIAALELPELVRDSYFYVHDTCEGGSRFVDAVKQLPNHDTASFRFHSMNIGLYSRRALERHRDLIMSFKNTDTSTAGLQAAKARCVEREDAVFRANTDLGLHTIVGREHPTIEPVSDVYGTGVLRRTTYYPSMDLFKHAANWKPRDEWELGL